MYIHPYTHVHTPIHTCTYTHTHMHIHLYTHMHMHIIIPIHSHPCIHTPIHPYTQALFVPLQGFLNAIVYGWTREDFLDIMASSRAREGQDSFVLSQEEEEEEGEGTESEVVDRHGNSILFLSTSQEVGSGWGLPVTPTSPTPRPDKRVGWEIQNVR